MPNSTTDEDFTNDTLLIEFDALLEGDKVTLEIDLDAYPNETTWELINSTGDIIYSGGPYTGQLFETVTAEWCLNADSCYVLKIYDSENDGLSSFFGDGDYRIYKADGTIIYDLPEPNFGSENENQLCFNTCVLTADIGVTNETSTGANNGSIIIDVTDGLAPYRYSIDGGKNFQNSNVFNNLAPGVYNVLVNSFNGCAILDSVEVGLFLSTSNIYKEYNISVSPNPSDNGIFDVRINYDFGIQKPLPYQIFDSKGGFVLQGQIAMFNEGHRGLVSLLNYPAGPYYLMVDVGKEKLLLKLLKQ